MSDSEYSSEDDEDYVPDAESCSEEEDFEGQGKATASKGKASKKKQVTKRKRKGGIKLEDEEVDDEEDEDEEDQSDDHDEVETEEEERKKQEKEEKEKKARMEDLWASFKSDTATVRAKPSNTPTSTKATPSKAADTNPTVTNSKRETNSASTPGKIPPAAAKVTIMKTYDFAGEAVTVTKTVDADSAEAKESVKEKQKQQQPEKQQQQQQQKATSSPLSADFRGTKRPGGLGSLLGQLGKKPKISTLEKSKLDWETFKSETGISDELRNFNKNGYLEKQDFLQRTDQRLFEREKAARNAMRK